MSILSRLFGKKDDASDAQSEDYKGFTVTPQPKKSGGHWRVSAIIEKDGQRHELIRADVVESHEVALQVSVNKARQMIDEQGERLFEGW